MDVIMLIGTYCAHSVVMNSYKFLLDHIEDTVFDLCQCYGMNVSFQTMMDCYHKPKVMIIVVDMTTYDECTENEKGEIQNCWSMQRSITFDGPILLLLTEKDRFKEKIKKIPLSVCPLFSEIESMDNKICWRAARDAVSKWCPTAGLNGGRGVKWWVESNYQTIKLLQDFKTHHRLKYYSGLYYNG